MFLKGQIVRIKYDNLNRVSEVRGEQVLIIKAREDYIRGRILGNTDWGQRKHEAIFGLNELEQFTPSWEV